MDKKEFIESFTHRNEVYHYYSLEKLAEEYATKIDNLPYSLRIILESGLRNYDGEKITDDHLIPLLNWGEGDEKIKEVAFKPHRILFHDTTGVPALVDLAMLRDHAAEIGSDIDLVNPVIPIDLVIDHSLIVDQSANELAITMNEDREFDRNEERFKFLKWAQNSFDDFRVFPPSSGIMHQINLEYITEPVRFQNEGDRRIAYPDSLVGADSHTTMINGLGIVGYGVGGIEAEAAMLGESLYLGKPEVVGVKLSGEIAEGSTATDLALTVTELLRRHGVVGKFVEFHGEGVENLTVFDRATIANMAPEYGATMSYFPVDNETLNYLEIIGREEEEIGLIEKFYKEQKLFRTDTSKEPVYSEVIPLNLGSIRPSLSGPKRPQDRTNIENVKENFYELLDTSVEKGGYELSPSEKNKEVEMPSTSKDKLKTGSLVLASITSCTNTSNPNVLISAGLLAEKALDKGLKVPSYVKTSFTPGSKVVTKYMEKSNLQNSLDRLGFNIAGYGCATCIGNSGDLLPVADKIIDEHDLVTSSVLSGNRNFEGRVHPKIKANYLASPPLVVAYALAGKVDINLRTEPLGQDENGADVFLSDLWPTSQEIENIKHETMKSTMFKEGYEDVMTRNERWNNLQTSSSQLYDWDDDSTYIQKPPFLRNEEISKNMEGSRVLLLLGDSVTTDHISPSGRIKVDGAAGQYLTGKGVGPRDFNSYPSRRGNYLVMERATFANVRVRNRLAAEKEGGYTKYLPTGELMDVFEASQKYKEDNTPLTIVAGKEYGTGSSRDWAAKGTFLLGVKSVIAESFERIHRSNLVCMGVLPLQFSNGYTKDNLGITGEEAFYFEHELEDLHPGKEINVKMKTKDGDKTFTAVVRLDNQAELNYYKHGGILPYISNKMTTA